MTSSAARTDVSLSAAWTAMSQWPALNRAMPALVSLVVLLAIAGALIPSFLLPDRLLLLGQEVAPLALVAIGQTLVVLMGGIDLSVGSVLTLSLVLGAGLSRGSNAVAPIAIFACLAIGGAIGLVNGLLGACPDSCCRELVDEG